MEGLGTLRAQTRHFINDLPTVVTFMRGSVTDDGAGGTTVANPVPVGPLTVKVTQQSESEAVERRNADGETVRPSLRLVAEWDADIAMGDTFAWNGLDCEVVWITALPYVKRCEVSAR